VDAEQHSGDGNWLSELLYYLVTTKRHDLCYVLHNVNIVATSAPIGYSGSYPIHAGCDVVDGQLQITLYWPIMKELSFEARLEVLEHQAAHIIEGHFTSYGRFLIDRFGPEIATAAMDVYVNQKHPSPHLSQEGLVGFQLQHLQGVPMGMTSMQYAEVIQTLVNEGKLKLPKFQSPNSALSTGTAGQSDGFPGKNVPYLMSEVLRLSESDGTFADERTRNIITSVSEALKMFGDEVHKKWRGTLGADHEQLMKASKRDAVVPWYRHLRAMETQHSHQIRTETRRRPSRRHPAYRGYTWTGGLRVAFLIDTSGSMGAEELKLVDPELRGMCARGATITVVQSDARVAKVHPYRPGEPLERFFGRGGTDYSSALMHIRQMHPRPHYIVGYTDGYGTIATYKANILKERGQSWWDTYTASRPDKSPDGFPTLWLLPEDCMTTDEFERSIVPWGKTIIVKKDRLNSPFMP